MKIAIFHELDLGGARRTVEEFAKRLSKVFEVDLYYVSEKKNKNIYSHNAFYYPFYPKHWKGNNWKARLYKDTIELIKLYYLHKKIAKEIQSLRYDFVLVNPSKYTQAPFLLRFLKNKSVYFCQEPLRIAYDPILSNISSIRFPKNIYEFIIRKIRKWIDLENLKFASVTLANSSYSKNFIKKSYGIAAKLCYLGVDTDFFMPLDLAKSIDILFIGNKDEGYILFNESLKFFKIKPKIFTVFRNTGNSDISDRELVNIYNKSKVLVALNQNEPFGLIVLEAMSCGTPVVALNEGGYRESVIDRKTGFLIERNPYDLYKKVYILINNEKFRKKISENARKNMLKNWTWNKNIERFLKIIKNER